MYIYGPQVTTDIEFERYLHRLDRKSMAAFLDSPNTPILQGQDLSTTHDYAIRVEQFNSNFKGCLTDNVSWRLNVWGMRKHGERQVTALNHDCVARASATCRPIRSGSTG